GNVYTFGDMSELEFKKALAREYGIHEEGRKTEEGKLLGATPGNIYSEYVINGSEEIEELPKDDVSSMPSDAEVVSDNLIKDFSKKVWATIKENVPAGLITMDVYVSAKTLVKYGFKVGKLTAGQVVVLTVSVIDGLDEINKYVSCGTLYGDCDTLLKKILGDDAYRVSKGVATFVGVTQIGKDVYTVAIKDGKIVEIGKKITDINELKAVLSSLKESGKKVLNKGKKIVESISKTDEALDVGNAILKVKREIQELTKMGIDVKEINLGLKVDGTVTTGLKIDEALGNNLGRTFKTFDHYDAATKTATSVKSMYLEGAKTYQTETGMYNVLKKYVDEIVDFIQDGKNGKILKKDQINKKILNVVINNVPLKIHHINAFKKGLEYAKSKGIDINITIIK
ncbi:endonuclease toxin domain-containing protein, partial [Streptobacillus canis]|uniref:endonuclease toxin domain-containing protein n=1 Tax=Streptobacillus canis TaxID=2678686 RepID=UPI001E575D73